MSILRDSLNDIFLTKKGEKYTRFIDVVRLFCQKWIGLKINIMPSLVSLSINIMMALDTVKILFSLVFTYPKFETPHQVFVRISGGVTEAHI